MITKLYRDAGQTVTDGNVPILLPLGQRGRRHDAGQLAARASARPTPCSSLWRERFGLEELTTEEIDPYFRRVERELNVAQVPPELAGRNAAVVQARRGRARLVGDYVYRNAKGCVGPACVRSDARRRPSSTSDR